MKHTILSERELRLIEGLIGKYGIIVSFAQVYDQLKDSLSKQETRNLVAKLFRNDWLIRIKKGSYAIADLSSHNFLGISPLVIASVFVPESYVSFEAGLNFYKLFDQMVKTVTSVCKLKSKKYYFQNLEYRFVKVKEDLYFGFKEVSLEGKTIRIAEREKIVLDYLYLRNDTYSIHLVLEKLREGKENFDFNKMVGYAARYPVGVKRRLGFLLDLLEIDTERLRKQLAGNTGYSKLTRRSKIFNSKCSREFMRRHTYGLKKWVVFY